MHFSIQFSIRVDASVCVRALQMCVRARASDVLQQTNLLFVVKVPFYMTDIDILCMASMHRIVIHCIDISMNRYTPIIS